MVNWRKKYSIKMSRFYTTKNMYCDNDQKTKRHYVKKGQKFKLRLTKKKMNYIVIIKKPFSGGNVRGTY